jgi:4-amino-4-deoxychorismate lyase
MTVARGEAHMKALINGVATNKTDAYDRGFHYGDGLFETIKVRNGEPCLWQAHIARLTQGCERLAIAAPSEQLLQAEAKSLCQSATAGVLKIIVTRGTGGRGYAPPDDAVSTRALFLYPLPEYPERLWREGVNVAICRTPLCSNPLLAGVKHLNRLEQILAKLELADRDVEEGLMTDSHQHVIEGIMSNVFYCKNNRLVTPSVENAGVQGVMRRTVLKLAQDSGLANDIRVVEKEDLLLADEVFLTNSVIGIWPVKKIDQTPFNIGPITKKLMAELAKLDV